MWHNGNNKSLGGRKIQCDLRLITYSPGGLRHVTLTQQANKGLLKGTPEDDSGLKERTCLGPLAQCLAHDGNSENIGSPHNFLLFTFTSSVSGARAWCRGSYLHPVLTLALKDGTKECSMFLHDIKIMAQWKKETSKISMVWDDTWGSFFWKLYLLILTVFFPPYC